MSVSSILYLYFTLECFGHRLTPWSGSYLNSLKDRLPMTECNFKIFDEKSSSVSIWTHMSILMLRLSSVDPLLLNDAHSRFYTLVTCIHWQAVLWFQLHAWNAISALLKPWPRSHCPHNLIAVRLSGEHLILLLIKKNSIESSFISCTLLIHLLHGLCTTFPHLSCDHYETSFCVTSFYMTVTIT